MKRLISMLLSILLITNNVFGYTNTIKAKGLGMVITSKPGNTVTVTSRTEDITGWEVEEGNIEIVNNQFVTPSENVKIKGIEAKEKYTFKLIFPYFTNEELRAEGEVISVEALSKTGELEFKSWSAEGIELTESQKVNPILEFTMPRNDITITANYEDIPWNAPIVAEELTPVNWNGSSWETTTEEDWDYNYEIASSGHESIAGDGTAKWANAQTSDGSLYVWIPRYTYKITSGNHTSGNSWSNTSSSGTNKIEVKFSDGTTDDTSDSYITHPAFTFGTDELEGIWVAKYEASRNDATESSAGSGTIVSSKPGVVAWRALTASQIYDYAYNLNRLLDSHLMRNSEWGAVAYLTNAVGKIPYKNNSSTYITGNAGGSQNASSASGVTNAWNTVGGVKASTTHNIYGIYDLNGGGFEYVSAYYTNGSSAYLADDVSNKTYAGSLYTNRDTKYVEAYDTIYSESNLGDAVYETSSSTSGTTSWDSNLSNIPTESAPLFKRGGYQNHSNSGIFFYNKDTGVTDNAGAFRPVLAILTYDDDTEYTITVENVQGGNIVVSPSVATAGSTITITSNPDTDYEYKGATISIPGMTPYKQELEYIESTGVQYISTGINPKGSTKVVLDAEMTSQATSVNGVYYSYFGAENGSLMFDITKATSTTWDLYYRYNTSYSSIWTQTAETFVNRRTIVVDGGVATIDGQTKSYTDASFEIPYPLYLFGTNISGRADCLAPMRLYSCQIYDDDIIIRDFIPVLDNDNIPCMYDKVNGEFYYNLGTGEFLYGTKQDAQINNFTPINLDANTTSFTMLNRDIIITPKWESNITYTVTFDKNDSTGTTTSQGFTHNVTQSLTPNTFTREGYTFMGWSTTSDGAVEYQDGTSFITTEDVILYAVWERIICTITRLTEYHNAVTVDGEQISYEYVSGEDIWIMKYYYGAKVTVNGSSELDRYHVNGTLVSSGDTYTFTLTQDVTIDASRVKINSNYQIWIDIDFV